MKRHTRETDHNLFDRTQNLHERIQDYPWGTDSGWGWLAQGFSKFSKPHETETFWSAVKGASPGLSLDPPMVC